MVTFTTTHWTIVPCVHQQGASFNSVENPTCCARQRQPSVYQDFSCVYCCRLLRWGTHTVAELAAADHANAAAELGDADLADRPRLLRWGISTTVDLAAADDANTRAQLDPVSIASSSIDDAIPDKVIGRPAAKLASRCGFKLKRVGVCNRDCLSTFVHLVSHKAIYMMQEAQIDVR